MLDKSENKKMIIASILVLIGAILFATKAIFVKLAYQYEVDSVSLLAIRMLIALPFFLVIGMISYKRKIKTSSFEISKKDILFIGLLGISSNYVASLLDFIGLQYVTAGVERLILFLYPTIVVILSFFLFKKPLTKAILFALIVTYIGIAFACVEGARLDTNPDFLFGVAVIFGAALAYSIYIVGSSLILPRVGTFIFTSLAMTFAGITIIFHHFFLYNFELFHFQKEVYLYTFLMATISTVLPSFLTVEGIRIIGPTRTSIISSVGPVTTIVLAYVFLGESFGLFQAIGTFFVLVGVGIISVNK